MTKEALVLVLTGPVGVGKSTVGRALSEELEQLRIAHALIDMDWLRWLYPSHQEDPFRVQLGYQNLAEVAKNYLAAGARVVILLDVVETKQQRATYLDMIPGTELKIVRLSAQLNQLYLRLRDRESASTYSWYEARAKELTEIMEARNIGELVISTDDKSPASIAHEVFTLCISEA